MYDYHSRSHSPRSPILARAVGSIVSGVFAAAKLDAASIIAKNRPERMRDPKGAGGFFKGVATLLRQLRPSPRTSRHAASGAGGVALAPDVTNQILAGRSSSAPLQGAGASAEGATRASRQAGRRSRHVPNENKTQTLEDSPREGLPPEHRNVSLSALFSRS
jgi:hypothetical protein